MGGRVLGRFLLLLLIVLTVGGGQIAAASDAIVPREPASVAQQNDGGSFGDPCPNSVSIWRPPFTSEDNGTAVVFSTYVPDNASVFYVVAVDGENEAIRHFSRVGMGGGVNMDGASIRLSETTAGTHRVNLVVFNDTNRNEQFEPRIDEECTFEGDVVETGEQTIDFDRNRKLTPTPTPGQFSSSSVLTILGYVLAAVFIVLVAVMALVVQRHGL